MIRTLSLSLMCLVGWAAFAEAQTLVLRGRLVHVDGLRTANVELTFGAHGVAVTDANGVFLKALDAANTEVVVTVQHRDWSILYPPHGRVVVPRREDVLVELFAGEPVERLISRALAEQQARISAELSAAGARQDAIHEMLAQFIAEVTDKHNVDRARLEADIERERNRLRDFPDIAATFRHYTLRARDLHDAFKLLTSLSIQHGHVRDTLQAAIMRYNDAYISMNDSRGRIETAVFNFWQDPQIAAEVRSLFDNDIAELHNHGFLSLNSSLVELHRLGAMRRPSRKNVRAVMAEIDRTLANIAQRLGPFETKTERFLEALFRN